MTEQRFHPIPLSPFAYESGEQLRQLRGCGGKDTPAQLTRLDSRILEAINTSLLTTPGLMHTHLTQLGWREHPQIVRSCLEKLQRHGYLTRMEFYTPEGAAPTRVYALGKRGRAFLQGTGQTPNRTRLVAGLDAVGAKKLLSSLQYLLYDGWFSRPGQLHMAPLVTEVVDKTCHTDHCFRPHALVRLEEKTVLVEAVREEPRALENLCETLSRMEATLRGRFPLNLPLEGPVELVLVCENRGHQDFVEQQLLEGGWDFDFQVFLTNDADTFNGRGFGTAEGLHPYCASAVPAPQIPAKLQALIGKVFG